MRLNGGDVRENEFWAEIYVLLGRHWPPELRSLGSFDWIEARRYFLGSNNPRVEGKLGLIGGSASEIRFVLFIGGEPAELSAIEWRISDPVPEPGSWISFDTTSETLELDPMNAR